MNREKIQRFLFVGAVCLLSFPWLTPCVGIFSAVAVDGLHNSVTKRDQPLSHLPSKQLQQWAAKPAPKLSVMPNQFISPDLRVSDAEVSAANGGRTAPRPGTLVGKGASAIVDGVTETLVWVDPFTWLSRNSLELRASKARRQLVLCESPFVMLEAKDIRFTRDGKDGPVRLAKATEGTMIIITPEGRFTARAGYIHFRGPSQEVLLELPTGVGSDKRYFYPAGTKPGVLMKVNFVKRTVSCNGPVTTRVF